MSDSSEAGKFARVMKADELADFVAPATTRARESDLRAWARWADGREFSEAGIATYIAEHVGRLSPATMRRRISTWRWAALRAGAPDPVTPHVLSVVRGAARAAPRAPRKAPPIMASDLVAMCEQERHPMRRAALLLGWHCAMRRSEIVALRRRDIEMTHLGAWVHVRVSKTDQEGRGQPIWICRLRTPRVCPVATLEAAWDWVAPHIPAGASMLDLPAICRWAPIDAEASILPRTVSAIVRQAALAANLPHAERMTGHSLRAGWCSTAAEFGLGAHEIQSISRHRSVAVLSGYLRDSNAQRASSRVARQLEAVADNLPRAGERQ